MVAMNINTQYVSVGNTARAIVVKSGVTAIDVVVNPGDGPHCPSVN